MRVGRVLGWVAVIAVFAGGGYAYYRYRLNKADQGPTFRAAKIERGRVAAKVTATGTLSARVTVQVGSQISGRLQDIFVDFNSIVKKGQVIAKIDPRLLQADTARARANYLAAKSNLEKAKVQVEQAERNLTRAQSLKDQGLMGQADYELAQTALASAKADVLASKGAVEQTQASLYASDVNLGFTTIVSPIDGIVISRNVDVGQTVAASLQAPVLFTIAEDLKKIQVDTFVSEADVGKLRDGMDATFTVDAFPGQQFKGQVRTVRNASQTVQNVVTYDAVVDVDNGDLRLKPGMTANATFVYAERDNALLIPNTALRFQPPPELEEGGGSTERKGRGRRAAASASGSTEAPTTPKHNAKDRSHDQTWRTVWVERNHKAAPVRIKIGISDGTRTEIIEGSLKEGDSVILETENADASASGGRPGGGGSSRRLF